MLSELAEEVLESLWILREEKGSERMRLGDLRESPDRETIDELSAAGIMMREGVETIVLTEEGLRAAADAVRRHRLAELLLTDILAVKEEIIHDTACQFEHHLHRGVDENICTLLGHPKLCPHGKPIPPGPCCREGRRVVTPAIAALADLKPGERARVASLSTTDPRRAQMLLAMGVVPGVEVTLLAGYPSYLFQIGEAQLAVDRDLAASIRVHPRRG